MVGGLIGADGNKSPLVGDGVELIPEHLDPLFVLSAKNANAAHDLLGDGIAPAAVADLVLGPELGVLEEVVNDGVADRFVVELVDLSIEVESKLEGLSLRGSGRGQGLNAERAAA